MVIRGIAHGTADRPTYHTNTGDNSPYDKGWPMGIELQANAERENQA